MSPNSCRYKNVNLKYRVYAIIIHPFPLIKKFNQIVKATSELKYL